MKTITEEAEATFPVADIRSAFQAGIFESLPEIVAIAKGSARKRIERMLRDGSIVNVNSAPNYSEQVSAFETICKYGLAQLTTKGANPDDGATEKVVYTFE